MKAKEIICTKLVKSEDLNHHQTLFAGRTAEWFVEAGFIAAAAMSTPKNIVCLKIHGMHFTKPANIGDMLTFKSKVVHAGNTSLVSYVKVNKEGSLDDEPLVEGFITFIHVNDDSQPVPHGITIEPETSEDIYLQREASSLKKEHVNPELMMLSDTINMVADKIIFKKGEVRTKREWRELFEGWDGNMEWLVPFKKPSKYDAKSWWCGRNAVMPIITLTDALKFWYNHPLVKKYKLK